MPDDRGLLEPELVDHEGGILEQLVHRVPIRCSGRVRLAAGQAVPPLVERDQATVAEMAGDAIPVMSVGAEAMQQKHRNIAPRAGFRAPSEVMEADATSLEPSVDRFSHRP